MIDRIFRPLRTVALLLLAPLAVAQPLAQPVEQATTDKLRAALEAPAMGLKVASVERSEISGLYAVQFESGPLVYATAAGDYFIAGDLYSVGKGGFVNLAEQRRDVQRAQKLGTLDTAEMIVFPAQGKPRAQLSVFTDVTCFYCQKLHREVPELNRHGVEVRYLAYPRAGLDSEGYRLLATAWCAKNPQETLTRLKNRETVPENVCPDNPIAAQFQLGQEMGVRGTPALVTGDGRMIPGYQSAADLMVTLGLE